MPDATAIAAHWGTNDVYDLIVAALGESGQAADAVTVEDLAPIDHFHARGFPATLDLADRLPVKPEHHILDIGCGLGGPARYLARRFQCTVSGIDITGPVVVAANKLTALLRMEGQVRIELGDGQRLPYADATFDGGYTQHVTMNVADRANFFAEAFRVLKPGAFFAMTEHCLGPTGDPHHPVPWSEDGSGAYLVTPARRGLAGTGRLRESWSEETGPKYLAAYKRAMERAAKGALPPLGMHLLMGESTPKRRATRRATSRKAAPIRYR